METIEIGKPISIVELDVGETTYSHIPIYMEKVNEKEVFVLLLTVLINKEDPLPCYRLEEVICVDGTWLNAEDDIDIKEEELINNEILLDNMRFPCYFLLNERYQYLINYLAENYQLDIEDIKSNVYQAEASICYYRLLPSED
jgi:hypothetical protein